MRFLPLAASLVLAASQLPAIRTEEKTAPWEDHEEVAGVRWKTLVGGPPPSMIPQEDVRFGTFELAPGATYPGHLHPAPELYFITGGRAEWTVGEETFVAEPGTAIYTPPNAVHRMRNLGDEPVTAVWSWWAPGGDRSVFEGYRMVERLPK